MRAGFVIFARYNSSRLPGKVLRDVAGRPLLQRVLDRVAAAAELPAVVATSDKASDDAIADYASEQGIACYRGSLEDVGWRALGSAEAHGLDAIIRICADSPFFDLPLTGRLLDHFQGDAAPDVATNAYPRSYPVGSTIEVITKEALHRSVRDAANTMEREHMTQHFYHHPDHFNIANVTATEIYDPGLSVAVDTPDELDRAIWVAEELGSHTAEAPLSEVIRLQQDWETITA